MTLHRDGDEGHGEPSTESPCVLTWPFTHLTALECLGMYELSAQCLQLEAETDLI